MNLSLFQKEIFKSRFVNIDVISGFKVYGLACLVSARS